MNLKILKKKDFSLLIFGEMISLIGTQLQDFALALYVLKMTGSALKFASVMAIALLPQLLLGPMAGVLVDWFDRKKIVIILNIINGVVISILTIIFYFTGGLKLSYIYVAVILMAINQMMFTPAVGTIIPTIMKKDELIQANSIKSLVQGFAIVASPMLAGTIYGFSGILPILILNSISFILASICEMFINLPKTKRKVTNFNIKQFKADFSEGILFVKNDKLIFAIVLSAFVINFSLAAISSVGLTFISKNILRVTDFQYGIMSAIICISYIVGPIMVGSLGSKSIPKVFKTVISSVCIILGLMAFTVSPIYIGFFKTNLITAGSLSLLQFVCCIFIIILNISLSTMFQEKVPNSMLGRVSSVLNTLCTAACPLGQVIFAFLFDKLSAYAVILLAILPLIFSLIIFSYASKDKNNISDLT